jgi:hypothetical protein
VLSHGLHLPIQADTVQEAARIQSEFVRTQAEAMQTQTREFGSAMRPPWVKPQSRPGLRPARVPSGQHGPEAGRAKAGSPVRCGREPKSPDSDERRAHSFHCCGEEITRWGSPYTEITQGRGASRAQCSLNGSLHVGRPRSPAAGRINASREEQQAAGRLARDRLLAARHGAGRTSQVPQRLGACPLRAAYARCAAASTAWTTRADLPQYWMGQRE